MTYPKPFKAVELRFNEAFAKDIGILRFIWGADIFLGPVPFLKSIILANVLVWIAMWVTK